MTTTSEYASFVSGCSTPFERAIDARQVLLPGLFNCREWGPFEFDLMVRRNGDLVMVAAKQLTDQKLLADPSVTAEDIKFGQTVYRTITANEVSDGSYGSKFDVFVDQIIDELRAQV